MKVIISGGGTGGHIYPALSIADALKRKDKNTEILYIGTASGLESSLVPKHGYQFRAVRVKGFRRKLSVDTAKASLELFKGFYDAQRILGEFKPDIAVGTGGYVAGPVLMIAYLKGIPIVIHEQNVLPGVTNRILGRFADAVAVGFEEAAQYFKNKGRIHVTGNPIRQQVVGSDRFQALKELGFLPWLPLILSFGGSKGSPSLNRAMIDFIDRLAHGGGNFQLLHAAGEGHYRAFTQGLEERGIELYNRGNIKVVPYLYDMPRALLAANLVITSAGAITIAEITAAGLPSILIPKSHATGNHQEYNAKALGEKGAAIVLPEMRLKGDLLYKGVLELIKDKERLHRMGRCSRGFAKGDAAKKIGDIVTRIAKG